jgi:hypothetical protein
MLAGRLAGGAVAVVQAADVAVREAVEGEDE